MVINACKTAFLEKKVDNKEDKKEIVKCIVTKLLEEELEAIEKENTEKIIKKVEWILINKYEITETNVINEYIKKVLDNIYGDGILEKYLHDGKTSDIRVVAFNNIFIKQRGTWLKT